MSAEAERFRIYRRRRRGDIVLVATCADLDAAMVAIRTLVEEAEFVDGLLGLLDRPDPEESGTWLINPYSLS